MFSLIIKLKLNIFWSKYKVLVLKIKNKELKKNEKNSNFKENIIYNQYNILKLKKKLDKLQNLLIDRESDLKKFSGVKVNKTYI